MVKPKAPLFGLGASGALGGAIVYGSWKGLDVAREYVIPANPQTAAQTTQRSYMTDAVDEWHTTGAAALEAADKLAWNRYAGVLGRMSGFNAFCRAWINEAVAGGTPPGHFYNLDVTDLSASSFNADIDGAGLTTEVVSIFMGTSKTFFEFTSTQAAVAGNAAFNNLATGFGAGTTVFFYFTVGTPGTDFMRTGLYTAVLT